MNFLKFLVLLFFCYNVVAAENRGYIDFGVSSESPDVSAQQPGSVDRNDGYVDNAVNEEVPVAPVEHPETAPVNEDIDNAVNEEVPVAPVEHPGTAPVNEGYIDNAISEEVADAPTQQTGTVRRSHFTSGVDNHEPVDHLLSLANDHDSVYFFTDLRNLEGQTITHRWEHNNQVLAEVAFNVQGPRWRVWSKKTLLPGWVGEIQVNVVDEQDRILAAGVLTYTEASQ